MKDQKQQEHPEFVSYHFLDANGKLHAMEEDGQNTEKFLQQGLCVDGSSIPGMSAIEKSDLHIIPEPESFLAIHLKDFEHYRYMAHLLDESGKPHPRDPRGILQAQVNKAHAMNLEPFIFSEIEFYIVDKKNGQPVDHAGYCALPPADKAFQFRQELGHVCKELGMSVKRIHHEVGPGQNEIELNLTTCMKNADDTLLCRWILELLADQYDWKVLFSPKPFRDKPGNGLHHHILLRDLKTGENICVNPEYYSKAIDDVENKTTSPNNHMQLSKICQHGIAGLIKYAADITAVFAASPESFERLEPGFEAPIYAAWDYSNRTTLVRVPKASEDTTRFEYRGGDWSGSVHLFGAVLLAAVLRGIQDQLELPKNANFNVEQKTLQELRDDLGICRVPLSFEECLDILETSSFLKETLGASMVEFLRERDQGFLKGRS